MTTKKKTERRPTLAECYALGREEAAGDVGMTYDDNPNSPRSRAYDRGRTDERNALPIPKSWPVQPLKLPLTTCGGQEIATCGTCGRSWDDAKVTSMTPTPAGRCPFESFH